MIVPVLSRSPRAGGWSDELSEVARAAAGGMLFGIPLLYTMEVWWAGTTSVPLRSLVLLLATYLVLVALHRTAGFRRSRDAHLADAAGDAAEALALSLVLSGLVLVLLREIDGSTPLAMSLGKVVHQALPFSLGVGVSRFVLTGSRDGDDDDGDGDEGDEGDRGSGDGNGAAPGRTSELNATVSDLGATIIGAVVIAVAIAPTDEVPMIAAALDPVWTVAMVAASLAISYAIVFVAGFSGQDERHADTGVLQHPATETVVCYLLSLACAAALLWTFGRLEPPFGTALHHVVVLGLPACIGAAAGRLAV